MSAPPNVIRIKRAPSKGFISVRFECLKERNDGRITSYHFTVILPARCKIPKGKDIKYGDLRGAIEKVIEQLKDTVSLDTSSVLRKLIHWDGSPPDTVTVTIKDVPAEGLNRLQVKYGAADGFGAMLSHPNISVVSKKEDGKLKLELAALPELAKNHEDGRNDCFFSNVLAANYGRDWTKKKFDWSYVMKTGKFRPDAAKTGILVEETKPLLQKMRMSNFILGVDGKLLAAEVPPTLYSHGQQSIYQLAHNRHLFLLDKNAKAIGHKVGHRLMEHGADDVVKDPSSKCWVPKEVKVREYFVSSVDEMDALILKKPEAKTVRVMYDDDVEKLFVHYLDMGYECQIKAANFFITGLKLHVDGICYSVKICRQDFEEQMKFHTEDTYKLASHHINRFQTGLMNELTRSSYAPSVMKAFEAYPMGGLVKSLRRIDNEMCSGFDLSRAYATIAKEIEQIPVLTVHDEFMKWDGVMREECFYLVENVTGSVRDTILCIRRYGIQTGHVLWKARSGLKVLAELRPSRLHENPIGKLVEDLEASGLPAYLKKQIPNVTIGTSTKTVNASEKFLFFKDADEAFDVCGEQIDTKDYGYIGRQACRIVRMTEGFFPLGLTIYTRMRLKLLQAYDVLVSKGRQVVGFRTDMIQVLNRVGSDAKDLPGGQWHLEKEKEVSKWLLEREDNKLVVEPAEFLKQTVVEVASGNCGNEGRGGSGKTYGLQRMFEDKRDEVLWLAPMNKRVEALAGDGWPNVWTVAHFIGCYMDSGTWMFREKLPEVPDGVKVIIVDEIFQLSLQQRERLLQRLSTLEMQVFYTGDPGQNCIDNGFCNNMTEQREEHALAKVFPCKVVHRNDYRRRTEEDRAVIAAVERRLEAGEDRLTVLQDYFHCSDDEEELLGSDIHLVKLNTTGLRVNLKKSGGPWAVGMPVVCRAQLKGISSFAEAPIEELDATRVKVRGTWFARSNFRLGYAQTIASTQGDTIDAQFTIWDAMHPCTTVKELVTAIGRCREVAQVHVFTGRQSLKLGPLQAKVDGVLATDEDAGRVVPEEHRVTLKWLRETAKTQNYLCRTCCTEFLMEWGPDDELVSVSIDRRDSGLGHSQKNCWLVHRSCNHAKKDKFLG